MCISHKLHSFYFFSNKLHSYIYCKSLLKKINNIIVYILYCYIYNHIFFWRNSHIIINNEAYKYSNHFLITGLVWRCELWEKLELDHQFISRSTVNNLHESSGAVSVGCEMATVVISGDCERPLIFFLASS